MPWGMSPELSKKTEEKIKEQNDVRFPENKNVAQGTTETNNKDQETYINFGVRFPEKGKASEASLEKTQSDNSQDAENKSNKAEAVNTIASEKKENLTSELIEIQNRLNAVGRMKGHVLDYISGKESQIKHDETLKNILEVWGKNEEKALAKLEEARKRSEDPNLDAEAKKLSQEIIQNLETLISEIQEIKNLSEQKINPENKENKIEDSDQDREQLIEQKKEELIRERERVTSAVESVKNQEKAMRRNLDALLENVAKINGLVAELNQAKLQDWSEIASSVDRRLKEIDGDRLLEQLESSVASIKDLIEKKQKVEEVIDQLKRSEASEDNEEIKIEIQNLTEEYNQLSMQISRSAESLSETSYAIQAMRLKLEKITLDNSNRINERMGTRNHIEDISSKFKNLERKLEI